MIAVGFGPVLSSREALPIETRGQACAF